jgi:hypothetical protein
MAVSDATQGAMWLAARQSHVASDVAQQPSKQR